MNTFTFTRFKTSSGLDVAIRPRSYAEWEKQEDARIAAIDGIPALLEEGKRPEAETILQRVYRDARSARLNAWVDDFDKLKGKLTLRDVAEIEKAAEALELPEVTVGNLDAGGNGQ